MAIDVDSSQWTVFGYDVRTLGRHWHAAWRDVLYASDSPLRVRLDEPVRLIRDDGAVLFQGGRIRDAAPESAICEAVAVPEALCLARTITLPAAAESELDAVLALEIAANSPFDDRDTVSGWAELARSDESLTIALVVAARPALLQWLHGRHGERAATDTELWAEHAGTWVRLRGFGEGRREGLYRRRLARVAVYGGMALALLYLIAGLFVLQQRLVLQQLDAAQRQLVVQASDASAQREALLAANESIVEANALIERHPNPHVEIARLTQLLGDDAFLAHFSMRGRDLRLRGRAADAAAVMQVLSGQPVFSSVTAPQAITAVGNTGLEQFYLDLRLADSAAGSAP